MATLNKKRVVYICVNLAVASGLYLISVISICFSRPMESIVRASFSRLFFQIVWGSLFSFGYFPTGRDQKKSMSILELAFVCALTLVFWKVLLDLYSGNKLIGWNG